VLILKILSVCGVTLGAVFHDLEGQKNIWLDIWQNLFSKGNFPITAIGYTISSALLANYIRHHASCRALIYILCYFLVFGSSAW